MVWTLAVHCPLTPESERDLKTLSRWLWIAIALLMDISNFWSGEASGGKIGPSVKCIEV